MRSTRGISFVFACVVVLSFTSAANADVMFSNLGPGDSFDTVALGFGPILFAGSSFTPTFTGSLDSIDLALSTQGQSPDPDPSGTQVILTDTGIDGKPGNILETFITGTIPGFGSATLVTTNSGSQPTLVAGDQYFIILGGGPGGGWFWFNSIGDTGPVLNGLSLDHLNLFEFAESAFRVNGTPLGDVPVGDVPEPSSVVLLGIGLIAMRLKTMR